MQLELNTVPFSRFGSYMCIEIMPKAWHLPGLILRTMHWSGGNSRELGRFEVIAGGQVVEPQIAATPTKLTLTHGNGRVEICFAEPDVLRIRGEGLGIRLSTLNKMYWRTMPLGDDRWQFNPPGSRMQYLLTTIAGRLKINAERHEAGHRDPRMLRRKVKPVPLAIEYSGTKPYEFAFEELLTTPTSAGTTGTFDQAHARIENEWSAFLATAPQTKIDPAAALAMYVNWSAVCAKSGMHRRPTMIMSKIVMNQCWSWDHCFNAMALAPQNADLAWDQLLTLFDHQDSFGCLPDSIMSSMSTWTAVKPPIHGWTLEYMSRTPGLLTNSRAKSFYPQLEAWTEWWMKYRDADGDGLPEYMNGCDSGWDNATVFDGGCPVAAPDLSAFLVLQMDMLATLAGQLGKSKAAAEWKSRADELLKRMIKRLWNGKQFISLHLPTGKPFPAGDCLLNFIPIILGKRLPKSYRDQLAAALKPGGRFITKYGPATESPKSPLYNPVGYWRGPIWAPETLMVVDGLDRGGYKDRAATIAQRFKMMCAASCFAENFEATTGKPLCDPAYTWTSSTYLCLK